MKLAFACKCHVCACKVQMHPAHDQTPSFGRLISSWRIFTQKGAIVETQQHAAPATYPPSSHLHAKKKRGARAGHAGAQCFLPLWLREGWGATRGHLVTSKRLNDAGHVQTFFVQAFFVQAFLVQAFSMCAPLRPAPRRQTMTSARLTLSMP